MWIKRLLQLLLKPRTPVAEQTEFEKAKEALKPTKPKTNPPKPFTPPPKIEKRGR